VVALVAIGLSLPGAGEEAARRLAAGNSLQMPQVQPVPPRHNKLLQRVGDDFEQVAGLFNAIRNPVINRGQAVIARAKPAPEPEPEPEQKTDEGEDEAPAPPPLPERELTLIVSGDKPTAMVDGKLVSEGDRLPRGGRVIKIGERSVWVQEHQGRRQRLVLSKR
jgi:hypothetical protein